MDTSLVSRDFARAGLVGPVIDCNHPDYDRLRRVWNGMVDRRPAAIVRAAGADDVAKVIRIAAERDMLLALRCGGGTASRACRPATAASCSISP
jgi:FAD/FMN-containing dehydrogenase